MRQQRVTFAVTCLLLTGLAASSADAADLGAAKAKVEQVCASCHNATGVSSSGQYPNLAGQKPEYLATQLRSFRDGTRTNSLMNAMAKPLSDADIENLAAYFSSLPPGGS